MNPPSLKLCDLKEGAYFKWFHNGTTTNGFLPLKDQPVKIVAFGRIIRLHDNSTFTSGTISHNSDEFRNEYTSKVVRCQLDGKLAI